MVQEADARAHFAELMTVADDRIELDRVALVIAQGEYAQLEPEHYLGRLDRMAADLRPRLSPEESPERLVAELNAYLFGEEGYRGNVGDYYDPRNSYLNEVIDRRTGIPITLSILYIELARRVRLTVEGVGMPGHFIVRCPTSAPALLVDPFHQGAVLGLDDCAERIRSMYGNSLAFTPELLRTSTRREIVVRILENLKGAYLRRGDVRRAIRAIDWIMQADDRRGDAVREKGLLRLTLGDPRGAIADLERYLELFPSGRLADETRAQLKRIEALWERRN